MRIAFYAPLKAADHPVPSGDRQMARLLVKALAGSGHEVELASTLRAYSPTPDEARHAALRVEAEREAGRIGEVWARGGAPDLWFTYHPYYKAPDLLGPRLAGEAGIPYVTAEASYSGRRNEGVWRQAQDAVLAAVRGAAVNFNFTERDRRGLQQAAPEARFAHLPPFIEPFAAARAAHGGAPRLIAVAMMRPGDKLESYRMLAGALGMLLHHEWTLTIVGGGTAEPEVRAAFAAVPAERIEWAGEVAPHKVPALLAGADIYVWPGLGEAYGLAYLEAGCAALPVVAQRVAGVPEAVRDGETGLLTAPGDVQGFAAAIARLLGDEALRLRLGAQGRAFVTRERSLDAAAGRLDAVLAEIVNG